MINFLHTFSPQPILFQFGWLTVYWYGIFIVLGIFAGLLVTRQLAKHLNISTDEVYNLVFYLVIFGLLGARLYAIMLDWPYYFSHPGEMIAVWHGGLAIHGAIIGGLVTLLIYTFPLTLRQTQGDTELVERVTPALSRQGRGRDRDFWLWADILAVGLPLAQAVGRWGNYFNQEVFGLPTNLPWGIPIQFQNRPAEYLAQPYFHPVFLYESVLDGLNFLMLLSLFLWVGRNNPASAKASAGKQESRIKNQGGVVFLLYLINYSVIRILMEFLRLDSTPAVFGLRWPVLVSGLVIMASLGFLWRFKLTGRRLRPRS